MSITAMMMMLLMQLGTYAYSVADQACRISGAAQVGRLAIDANVSSGENSTPKMRAAEFGFGSAAGAGVGAGTSVVIFSPRTPWTCRNAANCTVRAWRKTGSAAPGPALPL